MDSLQVVKNAVSATGHTSDICMYVAIVEFLLIIGLVISLCVACRRKSEKEEMKKKVMGEGDIDFKNVIDSSFKSKELYDALKGKCHPDKFATDESLNAKATEIFSLLVKNKHNYAALCELKERAKKELGIN